MRAQCVLLLLVTLLAPFAWSGEEAPQPAPEPFRAENGKWGFCTGRTVCKSPWGRTDWSLGDGKVVIPARFAWVGYFHDGMARVTEEGTFPDTHDPIAGAKWGFIDTAGKVVLPLKYEKVSYFRNGFAKFESGGVRGLIDSEGAIAIPARYAWLEGPDEQGHVLVYTRTHVGMYDTKGAAVIPPKYKELWFFRDGLARARRDKIWCWVDPQGKEHAAGKYERVEPFDEGLAAFRKDGKWGFVDRQMKETIPATWNYAGPFSQGMAVVRSSPSGKFGYIDRIGKLAIAEQFTRAREFTSSGLAVVYSGQVQFQPPTITVGKPEDEAYFIIDKEGRDVFSRRFRSISDADFSAGRKVKVIDGKDCLLLARDGTLEPDHRCLGQLDRVLPEIALEPEDGAYADLDYLNFMMVRQSEEDRP